MPKSMVSASRVARSIAEVDLAAFKECPVEIWMEIFSKCDVNTLRAARQVNHSFRQLSKKAYFAKETFKMHWVHHFQNAFGFAFFGMHCDPPICLYTAKKVINLLVYGYPKAARETTENGRHQERVAAIETLISAFPSLQQVAFYTGNSLAHYHYVTSSKKYNYSHWAWIRADKPACNSPEKDLVGRGYFCSPISCKDYHSLHKPVTPSLNLAPPSVGWAARLWELNRLHLLLRLQYSTFKVDVGSVSIKGFSNRYHEQIEKLSEILGLLRRCERNFIEDVGPISSPMRARFMDGLLRELLDWPEGPALFRREQPETIFWQILRGPLLFGLLKS